MTSTTPAPSGTAPRATQIARIIHKRRPLAQKIESVESNLKTLSLALHQLEKQRDQLLNRVNDSGSVGRLREIDCASIQRSIDVELSALNNLKARFSRNTLNIGVVGRARQGKSRLLQSLTGLSALEIPDGDDQHCTGVRSNIHHNPDVETYAEVSFHTERSFLDEVITPYYEQLHLGSRPRDLEEFANSPLPELPRDLREKALASAKYDHLCKYHLYLPQYQNCLSESSPHRISRHEIREYVAQDTIDRRRIYFKYLAVREVKIVCPFPNQDIGQIALVDMPGLGDTGIGDTERMIKTLGQDIDAVLFVRMPKSTGDFWATEDVELYDMANMALTDLPIRDWSFMALNHVSSNSRITDNRKNCESLAAAIQDKHIDVQEVIIANCADSEESQTEILDRVLNYLMQRIEVLDRQYASACQDRIAQLQRSLKTELEKAKEAWKQTSNQDWFPQFLKLFGELWKNLTHELDKLTSSMILERDLDDMSFKAAVDAAITDCRLNPGIPSLEEIENKNHASGAYQSAYVECLHEVRTNLSKRFLSLDEALKQSLETAKSRVVDILLNQGKLKKLAEGATGSQCLAILTKKIPEDLVGLRLGFQTLATFDLQYRGLIQHRIRKYLDVLTPNTTPYTLTGNFFEIELSLKDWKLYPGHQNAEKIFNNLTKAQAEAVNNCEKELKTILKEPSQAGFAIVEEFVDRVLWAEGVKDEWQIFLQAVASDIWTDEFGSLMALTQLRRDWMQIIEQAESNNQAEALKFLR